MEQYKQEYNNLLKRYYNGCKYLKEHPEIKINCGKRHCLSCLNCYDDNDIIYINELLKK